MSSSQTSLVLQRFASTRGLRICSSASSRTLVSHSITLRFPRSYLIMAQSATVQIRTLVAYLVYYLFLILLKFKVTLC